MLEGSGLEILLTTANSAAQAWYGYDQGIIAGIIIGENFLDTFPEIKKSSVEGIFTSCFSLGNLVGCLLAFLFGDRLGRRRTLWVGASISIVGAILQFSSTTFPQLMVGRIINGFGNGLFVQDI
jgi:MFS family permease